MITLVCSTYNSNEWIDGYLESVNSQIHPSFSIHFIDAGSTDGSWEKIKDFKFREGVSVKYTKEPGCSIYEAWNIGYKESNTEYTMNFNTDDRLYPAALSILLAYAKENPEADVIYSSYLTAQDKEHQEIINLSLAPKMDKETLIANCICGPFPLVRTKAAVDAGLFNTEFTISGDYEMWLRLLSKGHSFLNIPEAIGTYYWNPQGMSSNKDTFNEHLAQDVKIRGMYR